MLGSVEQRCQVINLVLDKIVIWGDDWAGECFVRGLPETQLIKHNNFIDQSLPDGYLHRCVSVWQERAIAVVFIQYFIIGQRARAHHPLGSLLSHY